MRRFLPIWSTCVPGCPGLKVNRRNCKPELSGGRWRGSFDLGQDFVYGVFNLEETQVLGGTGLHTRLGKEIREIGYWVHQAFTHQGLATETERRPDQSGLRNRRGPTSRNSLRPEKMCAARLCPPELGFTHEATLRKRFKFDEANYRPRQL